MSHPYVKLPKRQYWSGAILEPAPGQVDPATPLVNRIRPDDRIATMGSCFAQHIARFVQASGFNYLVTEPVPEGVDQESAKKRNYCLFSARYGNVYTPRQAVQLFDRAHGLFTPSESPWKRNDSWVDPFRPQIEPTGFASPEAVKEDQARHLAAVKAMFAEADWLVFTLGLTEGWRSKEDGAVFPIAPGIAGGEFDPSRYEFVNFGYYEVLQDIKDFRTKILAVNPEVRIILTVSPVPLAATFEDRHILVSTTASKAILRATADQMSRDFDNVDYFPSFEIINSPASAGQYFQDDLRQVADIGVRHVMRVFFKNYCELPENTEGKQGTAWLPDSLDRDLDILCDEELLSQGIASQGEMIHQKDFDESKYLELNSDVAEAVKQGRFASGWHHFVVSGHKEPRKFR